MNHRVGADIGGPFTDLVVVDEAGTLLRIAKALDAAARATARTTRLPMRCLAPRTR